VVFNQGLLRSKKKKFRRLPGEANYKACAREASSRLQRRTGGKRRAIQDEKRSGTEPGPPQKDSNALSLPMKKKEVRALAGNRDACSMSNRRKEKRGDLKGREVVLGEIGASRH